MKTKSLAIISIVLMPFVFAACGGDKPDEPDYPQDDVKENNLVGVWVTDPDYDKTIRLTFYPSGRAVEEWSDGYYSDITNGFYTYSNGKITKWDMRDGSILYNTFGDCPWDVDFIHYTKIALGSGNSKIIFYKAYEINNSF